MSRVTILVALSALVVGCSDYEFTSALDGQHGPDAQTAEPGVVSTPDGGTWGGGEDPSDPIGGGGSGALRPDEDPTDPTSPTPRIRAILAMRKTRMTWEARATRSVGRGG